MPRAPILALLRLHILVCIAVSAALLHDYSSSSHAAFCAVGSGCDAVRQSAYARVAGVPLPVVGLLAFAGLFGLTMFDHRVRRAWLAPVATVGAVSGVALLLIQHLALHTFCKLCVTVDVASIFAAGLAWLYRSVGNEGNDGAVHPMGWGGAGACRVHRALRLRSTTTTAPREACHRQVLGTGQAHHRGAVGL